MTRERHSDQGSLSAIFTTLYLYILSIVQTLIYLRLFEATESRSTCRDHQEISRI
jgi:hypothetical protein